MSSDLIMRTLQNLCPRSCKAEGTTAESSASWPRTFTCPRAQPCPGKDNSSSDNPLQPVSACKSVLIHRTIKIQSSIIVYVVVTLSLEKLRSGTKHQITKLLEITF